VDTGWLAAFAYLVKRGGGPVENRELAAALGYDPRGLRSLMAQREEFIIEVRNISGQGTRGVPYYRINPKCLEESPTPKHGGLLASFEGRARISCDSAAVAPCSEIEQDGAHGWQG